MAVADYIRLRRAIAYTGSNGAEVSTFAGIGIVSDTGTALTLGGPGWVFGTLNVGDYYESTDGSIWQGSVFNNGFITRAAAVQDTDTVYDPTAVNASIASLTTAVGGKLAKVDLVSISVPILLLNATADRVVTWNRPFNNTNYDLSYAFDASTIGRITCAPVAGTKTTTGVTIRITAGLLAVSVLGVVHVLGIGA